MAAVKIKFIILGLPLVVMAAGAVFFSWYSAENRNAFEIAARFYRQNQSLIENKNYLAVLCFLGLLLFLGLTLLVFLN